MWKNDDLFRVFDRISNGEASDEDISLYNQWCNDCQLNDESTAATDQVMTDMLVEIRKKIRHKARKAQLIRLGKYVSAACVILLLSLGGYQFSKLQSGKQLTQKEFKDILPAANKAVLTLSDGQSIILDNAQQGLLARQGGTKVMKGGSGSIIYLSGQSQAQAMAGFNTLSVPRGGQYQLELPDGTKVWLNAASSIRYPTNFEGKERRVSITGEVYLEVSKDAHHPFVVATRNADITVLGTHFNIMAYMNEPAVRTTLLEGSVKISIRGSQRSAILKPGEQATINDSSKDLVINEVNTKAASAWVHGLMSLNDCSVQELMNQISRLYDVDIEYAGAIPKQRFGGMINRNVHLSNLLTTIAAAGIHTKLDGKKVIVLAQ